MNWVNDPHFIPSPNAERVFRSLLQVPVVFEARKQSLSNDARLVECAINQNIGAQMIQILHTLEWCHIVIGRHQTPRDILLSCESPNLRQTNGQALVQIMSRLLNAYEEHSEVKAYDVAAPTAKRRRSNRSVARPTGGATEDSKEDTVRIGAKRITAMKNILSNISTVGFQRWQEHLGWVGTWKYNAMQDASAALENLWPGSMLPKERRPNELEDMAREVGHKVAELAPGKDQVLTRGELLYNERLSVKQHEMMLHKGFESYEAETLHMTNLSDKVALRPSTEEWLNYRQVIEHWDRTIREVAEKDMDPKDFKELEETVLNTVVMDRQILDAIEGYPKMFHMGMIPDLKAYYQQELDAETEKMQDSNNRFWQALFEKFQLELEEDQKLVRTTKTGSAALADLLEWLDLKSKIGLQQTSHKLAKVFCEHYFPIMLAESWSQLPGMFAVARAQEVPIEKHLVAHVPGRKILIIKADFNTPNARDAMKLAPLAGTFATMANQVGPQNVVVICALATRPTTDPDALLDL